ncbi:diguanylate cyclase [Pseudanabaena sp. FACHB-1277]|uniref:Diguanylate cyclase n=1 Tax=Pseudanabaena cinerea FACHB-1277 TaxID=2949581 RepID=A0A926UWC5_9CYAN|nr:diguanylate cyclase [Pseudanabaena cinerea]MBD2151272.1 diguanylate cyclase [Pseudanabaena cinerea FACHB-1277]
MYNLINEALTNTNSQPDSKGNILLVDDLPENLKLLSDLLSKYGYTARSVTSGARAIKTAKAKRPDVMFLDVLMPEMNGYQVCQAFKADPDLCDIPIIFISALGDTVDKLKGFEVGGVDYITKPYQVKEVLARLEAQLIIQKQQRSLQDEIAKRKEIEEVLYQSRSLLSSILNSALDGIAAMQAVRDPATGEIEDFRCLVVNPIISKMLGRNRDDLIGKLVFRRFIEHIDPHLFARFVEVVESGDPLDEDFYYPLDDSDSSWYHYVAVKLGDGFAVTVRDITSRKQTELALQEANRKLELLANLDGLTQIANRRRFNDYLLFHWQHHQREQKMLSLILIDIDYFKLYNDSYGHQGGDDCLIQVAQAIAKVPQRVVDLVARYGGEEFAVILPNTDTEGALIIAESIKQAIADLAIPHQNSMVSDRVTLSLGVASMIPSVGQSLEVLISNADNALYKAKKCGRDQAIAHID